jgi:DNA-binding winged helix-turn-helix (wHTH) protein
MGHELPGGDVSSGDIFRFRPFELDIRAGELTRYGSKIRLQEQPFQILRMLLARPGHIVLREELRCKLWPDDTVVEFDHSINAAIKRLRDALGDSADRPRYVETVARRGYRFIAALDGVPASAPDPAIAELNPDAPPERITRQPRLRSPRLILTSLAIVAAVIASLLVYSFSRQQPPDIPRLRFTVAAPEDTVFTSIYGGAALSPDGAFLAFTAMRLRSLSSTLWIRPIDSPTAQELPETAGATSHFWSPDSKWIASSPTAN